MPQANQRCANCTQRSAGTLCLKCDRDRRRPPIGPCPDCEAPLHRKSLPPDQRAPGSKFYGGRGRCTGCYRKAINAGTIPPPKESRMVANPQPRIVVTAWLTTEQRAQALCAQTDPELFFPEQGGNGTRAKMICAQCPIREACLEVAMANNERFGVFGGLSEPERDRLRAQRRKAAA